MNLEKKVEKQCGWTPLKIARATQSQLQVALQTPKPIDILKEQVIELNINAPNSSLKTQAMTPLVRFQSKQADVFSLVQALESLKLKYNEKIHFRNTKVSLLEIGDLSFLENAIEKDQIELKKINQEINDQIIYLSTIAANKRELLQILDSEDISSSQIRTRLDQITNQIDVLKRAIVDKM